MNLDARLPRQPRCAGEPFQLMLGRDGIAGQPRFAIRPRVKLHHWRVEHKGRIHLPRLAIWE